MHCSAAAFSAGLARSTKGSTGGLGVWASGMAPLTRSASCIDSLPSHSLGGPVISSRFQAGGRPRPPSGASGSWLAAMCRAPGPASAIRAVSSASETSPAPASTRVCTRLFRASRASTARMVKQTTKVRAARAQILRAPRAAPPIPGPAMGNMRLLSEMTLKPGSLDDPRPTTCRSAGHDGAIRQDRDALSRLRDAHYIPESLFNS